MKRTNIVREANIGTNLEFTNVELTVIRTKWLKICQELSKTRVHSELKDDINHFDSFINRITSKDVLSLEDIADQLFSSEEIEDINELEKIGRASVAGYQDKPGESI